MLRYGRELSPLRPVWDMKPAALPNNFALPSGSRAVIERILRPFPTPLEAWAQAIH